MENENSFLQIPRGKIPGIEKLNLTQTIILCMFWERALRIRKSASFDFPFDTFKEQCPPAVLRSLDDPGNFSRAVSALVKAGFLEKRPSGRKTVYTVLKFPPGEKRPPGPTQKSLQEKTMIVEAVQSETPTQKSERAKQKEKFEKSEAERKRNRTAAVKKKQEEIRKIDPGHALEPEEKTG